MVTAGNGRKQSPAQIPLAHAVFRPVRNNVGQPVVGKYLRIDTDAVLLRRNEKHKLQIQVIVRQNAQLFYVVRVIRNVGNPLHSLERRP